jgi:hypothetical protein
MSEKSLQQMHQSFQTFALTMANMFIVNLMALDQANGPTEILIMETGKMMDSMALASTSGTTVIYMMETGKIINIWLI